MDTKKLRQLIKEGKSSREIAKILQTSQTNIRYWLKKDGLRTTPRHGSGKCQCPCGETDSKKFYGSKRSQCAECFNTYKTNLGAERRLWAIQLLGGKCSNPLCGFCEYSCSLDFHHCDPKKKDPDFNNLRYWSQERIKEELLHCLILCKNCHAAVHAGLLQITKS
jgi:hypothetical protein